MPTLKVEQYKKWSSVLPDGWKFDAQHYVFWGEKEIFTDSPENEKGVFYRLTLEYRAETVNDGGYYPKETGRQIPTVTLHRYTPTGSGLYSVVHIMRENAAEPEKQKKYNVLLNLAGTIDTADYFKRAAEKDTGKQYNDFSDFCAPVADAKPEPTESAEDAAEPAQEVTESAGEEPAAEIIPETESTTEAEESADNGAAFDIPTIPEKCRKAYFEGEMTLEQIAAELYSAGMIAYIDANAAADYLGLEHEEEPDEDAPAETVTEDAQTVEEPAPEESKEEPAPAADMFATLAAAYFAGKTVKSSKPRTVEPKAEEPPKEEEPAPEPEPEPPAPPVPGFHENSNNRFTEAERKALSEGLNVWKSGDNSQNYCFFSATYTEGVRLVYSSYAWKDSKQRLQPDKNPEYSGFLVGTDFYSNPTAIRAKFNDDINRFIVEHIASEESAAQNVEENAEAVHGYEQSQIKDSLSADYAREAQDLFYKREKPELVLYSGENHDTAVLIDYILEPERMIEQAANEYMKYRAAGIYRAYIRYNRISAALSSIESDAENKCHVLRRISETVGDHKTVKILLSSGHTVKCEARGIKNITNYGTISDYYVLACDRQYLRQNQYRHYEDIDYTEIKRITHGGRVLYSA